MKDQEQCSTFLNNPALPVAGTDWTGIEVEFIKKAGEIEDPFVVLTELRAKGFDKAVEAAEAVEGERFWLPVCVWFVAPYVQVAICIIKHNWRVCCVS